MKFNQSYVGKTVEILWEEEKDGVYKGHTKNYLLAEYMASKKGNNEVTSIDKDTNLSKEKLENQIKIATVIKAEKDHILVEM